MCALLNKYKYFKMATIESQLTLANQIKDAVTNLKRGGVQRKTDQTLENTQHELNILWKQFNDGHAKLQISAATDIYFKEKVFEKTLAFYNEATDLLNNETERRKNSDDVDSLDDGNSGNNPTSSTNLFKKELDGLYEILEFLVDQVNISTKSNSVYKRLIKEMDSKWSSMEIILAKLSSMNNDIDLVKYRDLQKRYLSAIFLMEGNIDEIKEDTPKPAFIMSAPKLPEIQIAKFDGNYIQWRQFKNMFTSLVINGQYSGIHKLAYLKSYLVGEAAKLIQHLQLSEENFDSAWTLLSDRYDNERLQVAGVLEKLLKQPNIQQSSATMLKSLHDVSNECIYALANMGIDTKNWDPLLHYLLLKKLDTVNHGIYEQQLTKPKELQTTKSLLQFLEARFQMLELLGSKPIQTKFSEKKALVAINKKTNEH